VSDEYTPETEQVRGVIEWRNRFARDKLTPESYDRMIEHLKAAAWDECLDAIEANEINTEQARAGNPYRTPREGQA
jgi:hypothetical protein